MINEEATTFKSLIDKVVQYIETNVSLIKLKLIDKGSSVISAFLAYIIIAVFVILLIVLLSIGVSLWLGKMLGETFLGFFVTAGFFIILSLLLYKLRNKWLKMPIANSLLKNFKDDNRI